MLKAKILSWIIIFGVTPRIPGEFPPLYVPLKMNIFLLAQTDGSVGNRLFGSADSFLENRTEGSAKPIIRSDTILCPLKISK